MSDVLLRVTAVDYESEEQNGQERPVIQLAGRDEDGNRRTLLVDDTVPYFYVREDQAQRVESMDEVRSIDPGYESFDGIPLARVNVQDPSDANTVEDEFGEAWESDIPFYHRATIDYALSGHIRVPDTDRCSIADIETEIEIDEQNMIDPRIFIADIEVLQTGNTDFNEMMEEKNCPVSHITVWDSQPDEYIVLYLDPDDEVASSDIAEALDGHSDAESLSVERAKDINLRSFESESALLSGFLTLFENRRPDLTSGWNWVDFDWDYLLGRFENVGEVNEHRLSDIGYINGYQTERKVDCLPAFDMMDAYTDKMTFSEWRSSGLNYVAKEVLGVGKLPNVSITWAFEEKPAELVAYNIIDVMLCVALDRREGVHDFFYELAELSQVQIYDTFSEMRLIDGYIMSRSNDNEILPSAEEKDIPENAGGLVLDPSDGVREWVGVIDLASLYPSVIITWNISPETIHWYEDESPGDLGVDRHIDIPMLPDADHAEGGEFGHDEIDFDVMWSDLTEEGIIPKYLKRLFPERQEKKDLRDQYKPDEEMYQVWDRKQAAVKVIMNSFYGVMSMDYWRLGMYGLGDGVTSTARYALWKGKEIAQAEGYEVYYGDTDSVMLEMADEDESKEVALERGHDLEDAINSRMDECVEVSGLEGDHPFIQPELHGTSRHALEYEFEKLYRRFFQAGQKKRYAGNIVWKEGKDVDGEIDMTGFESKRSDSPEITSEVQPEVVNRILAGEGFTEVSDYVRGLISDIKERQLDLYKVALPKSVGQPLQEYGNTPAARACRYSNKNLDKSWEVGDDPWMYYIRTTPPMTPGTDVIALQWDEELPDGFELDLDKTLERALEKPLKPILQEAGWKFGEVKEGAQTQSAADWGSNDWETDDNDNNQDDNDDDEWGW